MIVYAGPSIGDKQTLLAIRPDGTRVELPSIRVRGDGERHRFLPDGRLVYMQGDAPWQDFWVLDVVSKQTRQLTRFDHLATMRTFDITPDGKYIVFDRLRPNSDIVLIDVPRAERN